MRLGQVAQGAGEADAQVLPRDGLGVGAARHAPAHGDEGLVSNGPVPRVQEDRLPPGTVPAAMVDRQVGGHPEEPGAGCVHVARMRGGTDPADGGLLDDFLGDVLPHDKTGDVGRELPAKLQEEALEECV